VNHRRRYNANRSKSSSREWKISLDNVRWPQRCARNNFTVIEELRKRKIDGTPTPVVTRLVLGLGFGLVTLVLANDTVDDNIVSTWTSPLAVYLHAN